jgi:outer membrane protein OmpA-like peptidoglycan-associated protein
MNSKIIAAAVLSLFAVSAYAADTLSNGTAVDSKGEATANNTGVENGLTQNSRSTTNMFNFPQAVQPGMVAGNTRCTNHGVNSYGILWNLVSFSNPEHLKDADCDVGEDIKYLTITCQFKTAADLLTLHLNKKYPDLHAVTADGSTNLKLEDCFKKQVAVPQAPITVAPQPEAKIEVRKETVVERIVSKTIMLDAGAMFHSAKDTLQPEAVSYLKSKLAVLANLKNVKVVRIHGHTDDVGSLQYNQKLSERRAQTAAAILRSLGFEVSPEVVVGYGKTRPVVTNDSETGRAMNRRVEIEVTGSETVSETK